MGGPDPQPATWRDQHGREHSDEPEPKRGSNEWVCRSWTTSTDPDPKAIEWAEAWRQRHEESRP
jgi:hypothetical protein